MDTAGYFASIFIGIALGLIGGGGSILTVPVLVYLFSLDVVLATAYSLFIVGATSAVGSFSYFKKGLVNIKTAIVFGIPSIAAVFLTRAFIIPAIPNEIFSVGEFIVTKSILLMLLFAVLMIIASYSMIKREKQVGNEIPQEKQFIYPLILLIGTVIGILTGLVGAGGGFLIIPALVSLVRLKMKEAIGTSLLIIAFNSIFGFVISVPDIMVDWIFLFKILTLAIIGVLAGSYLSRKIDNKKLKPAFGWFVLVMGLYIIIKEIVVK